MDKMLSIMTTDPRDRRMFGGDSMTDQMNSVFTVYMLIAFALIIQARHLIGDPIHCWCPSELEDSQVDYANSVCWTSNTYILAFGERIPKEDEYHDHISYYQWVALILTAQAILFYIPRPIWRLLNKKSGIAVSTITDAAIESQKKSDADSRDKAIRYMVKHMGRFLLELSRKHMIKDKCHSKCWTEFCGNYLVLMYMVVKCLYIANSVGQLYMLNTFLGTDFNMYGITILQKMVRGEEWTSSERFPRITLCDFKLFVLGDIHRYTIQCSLPMNLFNEMIFIFIWFWLVIVTFATACSLVSWIYVMSFYPHNRKHIRDRLVAMDKIVDYSSRKEDMSKFTDIFLRRDGVFIIRMVGKNSSDLISAELISGLWDYFIDNKRKITQLTTKYQNNDEALEELNTIG